MSDFMLSLGGCLLSIFDFDACYEGSTGGQNGVEFNQESTGHVRFFLALLLADQWEAEIPDFLVIWPTDKYEGSKWGKILPGIHWSCWIFSSPLIGRDSQWEAENSNFLVIPQSSGELSEAEDVWEKR